VLGAERLLRDREVRFAGVDGAGAKRMLLMVAVMTVHSAAEGVAVGVAFGGTGALAASITIAIAVQTCQRGSITAVLRPRGVSLSRCVGWSIFSSLPQPLLAVPAFLFVQAFATALPYGLGFAAGAMMFMVFEELLPEAYGDAPRAAVAALASLFLVAMVVFQRYL
jgi:zinc transporter ZupT